MKQMVRYLKLRKEASDFLIALSLSWPAFFIPSQKGSWRINDSYRIWLRVCCVWMQSEFSLFNTKWHYFTSCLSLFGWLVLHGTTRTLFLPVNRISGPVLILLLLLLGLIHLVCPHSWIGLPTRQLPVRVQGWILLPGQERDGPLLQRCRHWRGVRKEAHGKTFHSQCCWSGPWCLPKDLRSHLLLGEAGLELGSESSRRTERGLTLIQLLL